MQQCECIASVRTSNEAIMLPRKMKRETVIVNMRLEMQVQCRVHVDSVADDRAKCGNYCLSTFARLFPHRSFVVVFFSPSFSRQTLAARALRCSSRQQSGRPRNGNEMRDDLPVCSQMNGQMTQSTFAVNAIGRFE